MKKTAILTVIIAFIFASNSFGQECKAYFPMKKGVSFEITNYNAKGKEGSKALHTITNYEESGGNMTVDVTTEVLAEKQEEPMIFEYQAACENGKFRMNRFGGMSTEQMGGMGTVDIDGDYLEIPENPSTGQMLPDSKIIMTVKSESVPLMTFTYDITNRKVEGYEEVETPAGKYKALKISYDVSTKMIMTIQSKMAEWFVEGVGVVKSEQYNNKGKLKSYSLLTALEGV